MNRVLNPMDERRPCDLCMSEYEKTPQIRFTLHGEFEATGDWLYACPNDECENFH